MPPNTEAHGERSPARARRGAALLLVLGLIATLGWLAARIVLETRRNLAERAVFVRREQLRATAWSAAECVLAALREKRLVDGELYSLPHDASSLLNATGYVPPRGVRIGTDLRDLSAKTALRSLDADSLRDLFTDLGIPFDNASRLADNYLDAVASPDSRNAADGPLSGAASPKLGRLPDDFHELLTIPGFREHFQNADGSPNDLARDFLACVAFRGDTAGVNLNTAALPALRRLAKRGVIADPVALDRWLAGPDAVRGTDDDRFARDAAELGVAGHGPVSPDAVFTVRRIRLGVTVHIEDASFLLTLVADPTSEKTGFPWRLLHSEENRIAE